MANVRNLHKIEIEELELNAARKTQQICDQLKQELSKQQNEAWKHDKAIIQAQFDQKLQLEKKALHDETIQIREQLSMKINEFDFREKSFKLELENALKMKDNEFQDRFDTQNRQFNNEIRILNESKETEIQGWKSNFMKDCNVEMSQNELKIRNQCQKEKQFEIDEMILKFENETLQIKQQYEQINESRIKYYFSLNYLKYFSWPRCMNSLIT